VKKVDQGKVTANYQDQKRGYQGRGENVVTEPVGVKQRSLTTIRRDRVGGGRGSRWDYRGKKGKKCIKTRWSQKEESFGKKH